MQSLQNDKNVQKNKTGPTNAHVQNFGQYQLKKSQVLDPLQIKNKL
jgi:hypothetical protein